MWLIPKSVKKVLYAWHALGNEEEKGESIEDSSTMSPMDYIEAMK